jgi:hypothetical protein
MALPTKTAPDTNDAIEKASTAKEVLNENSFAKTPNSRKDRSPAASYPHILFSPFLFVHYARLKKDGRPSSK